MFDDCGSKIKAVAKILFWVSAVLCIVLACVFGWVREYPNLRYSEKVFQPIPFFSILIGGLFFSYIGALFMTTVLHL